RFEEQFCVGIADQRIGALGLFRPPTGNPQRGGADALVDVPRVIVSSGHRNPFAGLGERSGAHHACCSRAASAGNGAITGSRSSPSSNRLPGVEPAGVSAGGTLSWQEGLPTGRLSG